MNDNENHKQAIQAVEYYSGVSPIPVQGELRLETKGVYFLHEEEEIFIPYSEIVSITAIGGNVHIEINVKNIKAASKRLVVTGLEHKQTLESHWLSHKPNIFKSIEQKLHGYSIKKILLTVAIVLPPALFLYFTFINQAYHLIPTTVDRNIGESSMKQFNRFFDEQCDNPRLVKAVNKIFNEIPIEDKSFSYNITIIDQDIVNALAFPGGNIVIFRKLLEKATPEELAGVLAHEMVHIEKRHSIQNMVRAMGFHLIIATVVGGFGETLDTLETVTEVMNTILFLKYSRGFEAEADASALSKLVKSGIDPRGLLNFFVKIKRLEDDLLNKDDKKKAVKKKGDKPKVGGIELGSWVSSHPLTEDRIEAIRKFRKKNKVNKIRKNRKVYKIPNWKWIRKQC